MRELTERKLLQRHTPAGALVDEHGGILYLHGNVNPYIEVISGEPDYNILEMAREGLKNPLISALRKANTGKKEILRSAARVKIDGDFKTIDLIISPVEDAVDRNLFLVTFYLQKDILKEKTSPVEESQRSFEDEKESIEVLKEELLTKEEYLEASTQELELKNEELESSNEEMQSTNEELETSREELHSLNEELETLNAELQAKVSELSKVNDDINNILDNTGMGIVFVDAEMRIQRFTPTVTKVINLIPSDVGRPLKHTVSNFSNYTTLLKDIGTVLDSETSKDIEINTDTGESFIVNVRPYRTTEGNAKGAIVTFTDAAKLKTLRGGQKQIMEQMDLIMRESGDAIIQQDMEGNILLWNQKAQSMYGWSEEEALKMNIMDMIPSSSPGQILSILKKISTKKGLVSHKFKKLTRDGRTLDVSMAATPLFDEKGKVHSILTVERKV